MANTWHPNGKLADGTLLMGPFRNRSAHLTHVYEFLVDGTTWRVAYCCAPEQPKELSPEQQREIEAWAAVLVAKLHCKA